MSNATNASAKKSRPTAKTKLKGGGAIAQGGRAKAAGKRAVIVDGNSHAPIHTGDTYQTFIQRASRAGASTADLRNAYLAWLSMRANELPLLAGDSGEPVQLSSVYTALLTTSPERDELAGLTREPRQQASYAAEHQRRSALEAMDAVQRLVLMGGPGSGKSTFLNFVALCMAGELLGLPSPNLELLRAHVPADPQQREEKPRQQRWRHKALLPVRVVLRDFAADLPQADATLDADTLWDFVVRQLPKLLKPHAEALQAELLRKGGLILLDGLDEVPEALERREQVKRAVEEFAGTYTRCRFLVTSRTYAYQRQDWKLNGFAAVELLPFTRGQIERFIDTWYAHMARDLFRLTQTEAAARAQTLKRATQRSELRELAERPLLLTLMARLQTKGGGSLPENREELYAQSVDMLLEEWEGLKLRRDAKGKPIVAEPSLSEWLNSSRESIRRELDKLAYEAHLNQPKLDGTADIRRSDVIAALIAASKDEADTKLLRLEEFLRDRAGLLTSHGDGLYQFPHRSFQEYLAACHLARFQFPDALCRLAKSDSNRWREVTLLAAARSRGTPSSIWELVEELCAKDEAPADEAPEASTETQWGALLAGQVLAETGLAAYDPALQERHERKRKRVRDWQLRLLHSTVLPARERALAGNLLASLAETRQYLLDVDHLRFSAIPCGPFWMGGEGDTDGPLHLNESMGYDYWIAQTPVTVAQFRQFVTSSGYGHDPACLRAPENRPVVFVTWHDAQAFCGWLSERFRPSLPEGWRVMLPSEAEWEKAARGGVRIPASVQVTTIQQGLPGMASELYDNPLPQRAYPWGDEFVANHANVEMDVGDTSTSGCFALGRSAYDCDDMAGNVWEWTRSLYGEDWSKPASGYPYRADDTEREDSEAGDRVLQVVRGGSWYLSRGGARCASRFRDPPGARSNDCGFRVVLRSAPLG